MLLTKYHVYGSMGRTAWLEITGATRSCEHNGSRNNSNDDNGNDSIKMINNNAYIIIV